MTVQTPTQPASHTHPSATRQRTSSPVGPALMQVSAQPLPAHPHSRPAAPIPLTSTPLEPAMMQTSTMSRKRPWSTTPSRPRMALEAVGGAGRGYNAGSGGCAWRMRGRRAPRPPGPGRPWRLRSETGETGGARGRERLRPTCPCTPRWPHSLMPRRAAQHCRHAPATAPAIGSPSPSKCRPASPRPRPALEASGREHCPAAHPPAHPPPRPRWARSQSTGPRCSWSCRSRRACRLRGGIRERATSASVLSVRGPQQCRRGWSCRSRRACRLRGGIRERATSASVLSVRGPRCSWSCRSRRACRLQ